MNDTEKKNPVISKRSLIVKFILTFGVLAVLFWKVDVNSVVETIKSADPLFIIASIACLFAQTYLIAWRWMVINMKTITSADKLPGFLTHWHYLMISFWFNLALPSSVGGDAVRVWTLRRVGIALSQAANSVILDRISALLAVVILIGCGLPFLTESMVDIDLVYGLVVLLGLAVTGVISLFYCERFLQRWDTIRIIQVVIDLSKKSKTVFVNPTIVFSAIIIHLITTLSFYCILLSFNIEMSFFDLCLVMPAVILLSALPISISGWGVREGSLVVGLGIFGVDTSTALTASILFGFSSIIIGVCGGYTWLKDKSNFENLT